MCAQAFMEEKDDRREAEVVGNLLHYFVNDVHVSSKI